VTTRTPEPGNEIVPRSYILAFVAYNAGPRRTTEWIGQYGDPRDPRTDPIDWVDAQYVQRVLENMQI
jgi:soluble lytic murein transglycosylase